MAAPEREPVLKYGVSRKGLDLKPELKPELEQGILDALMDTFGEKRTCSLIFEIGRDALSDPLLFEKRIGEIFDARTCRSIMSRLPPRRPPSPARRKGISVPLSAVLLTIAALTITSFAATGSLLLSSSLLSQVAQDSYGDGAFVLHQAIESAYLSNPGTSVTVSVRLPAAVTCAGSTGGSGAARSTVSYPVLMTPNSTGDPAGIVLWNESSTPASLLLNGLSSSAYSGTISNPFSRSEQTIIFWIKPNPSDTVIGKTYYLKDYPGATGELYVDGSNTVRRCLVGVHQPGDMAYGLDVPAGSNGPFALTVLSKVTDNTPAAVAWTVTVYEDGVPVWSYSRNANQHSSAGTYSWWESSTWFFSGSKRYTIKVYWPGNVDVYIDRVAVLARRGGVGYGGLYPSSLLFEKGSTSALTSLGYYTRKSDGTYDYRFVYPNIPLDRTWHMVAGTLANGTKKIYVDGALKGTFTGCGDLYQQSGQVYVGSIWRVFWGEMDDVMIFNRALNDTEISFIWQRRAPMNSTGMVVWYRFDEPAPGLALDSSGNNYHASETATARSYGSGLAWTSLTYAASISPFSVPPGSNLVSVSKGMDGTIYVRVVG
ncbi:MAG: LamG-like jellyroll fold domain-containing protein [Candidatus Methanomethyliaceae archaeon]